MNVIKFALKVTSVILLLALVLCFIRSRMDHFSQVSPFCRARQKSSFRAASPEQADEDDEFENWEEPEE